ncbi:MAG: tRNA lysidine(34) synthetase TilS [Thermoanaerobaculaceae bacterium]|nr:tRNA lysidine(34) synthetase TilS [Thermoanaerobaculaceae bacterium]
MLVTRFAAAFRRYFPDLLGRRVVVGISGGSDSVALLRLLVTTRQELGVEPLAAHVHHHLRGEEAEGDRSFCEQLATSLAVPFALRHLDPRPPRGVSPEGWWRQERYRLLEEVRQECGGVAVATAHTRDDQAETVLLKVLRGAGPRGVAGVRRRVGAVVRPLLDFRREELRQWLATLAQGWREDVSNTQDRRPRVLVRQEVLPALCRHWPAAVEHLAALAEMLAEDEEVLAALLAQHGTFPTLRGGVPLEGVRSLPPALQRRWLLAVAARLPLGEPPSRRQLDQFLQLLAGGQPAAVDLGRRWVIRRRGEVLELSPPPLAPFAPVAVVPPSQVTLPGGFQARLGVSRPERAGWRVFLSRRCEGSSLAWRSRAPGERLPTTRTSLSAALARAGVPAAWRRGWPVLAADGTMIWAPGVGVAPGWEGGPGGVVAELEEPWQGLDR